MKHEYTAFFFPNPKTAKSMPNICTRNWETPESISLNLVLMFNRTYAKLAWVYAKGMCGFRHQVFNPLNRICQ